MSAGVTNSTLTWRPPPQGRWTYTDYQRLPDNGFRYEVIEGHLLMSPAPSPSHQLVLNAINVAIFNYLQQGNRGRVIPAPIDVKLDDAVIVQPDLAVVLAATEHRLTESMIDGAPDLVVEVLSPSSDVRDRRQKFRLYSEHGVREYWIVDPAARTIEVYVLRGEAYSLLATFSGENAVESEVLTGLKLQAAAVFA